MVFYTDITIWRATQSLVANWSFCFFFNSSFLRFTLALESNNLEVAVEAAQALDDKQVWLKLADLSLLSGQIQLTETCYQKAKCYDKLLFLYCITGQMEKMTKLGRIFRVRGEIGLALQSSLLTGNSNSFIEVLQIANQQR